MKLDIKDILILVLLGISLFLGYSWYFKGNSGYKEKVKQLEKEYKELEKEKNLIDLEITKWKSKYDSLEVVDKKIQSDLLLLQEEVKRAEEEAKKSKQQLSKIRAELAETRKKIEEFKRNPPNRTGDDLLESLKNKTK